MVTSPPRIASSTQEERLAYVRERFVCIANCDLCGNCALFHGKNPEHALADYIAGTSEFRDVVMSYRR